MKPCKPSYRLCCRCRKTTHTPSNNTVSGLHVCSCKVDRNVQFNNLWNGLYCYRTKVSVDNIFCLDEYLFLKEYIFALLIQFLTFLLACCFLLKSVSETKGHGQSDLNVKSNNKWSKYRWWCCSPVCLCMPVALVMIVTEIKEVWIDSFERHWMKSSILFCLN